jgi:hypothetical protein
VLEKDLDLFTGLGRFLEFIEWNGAFGLEADIEDDGALGDPGPST